MKNLLCLFLLVTSISFGQNYAASSIALNYRPFNSFQDDEINMIIDGNPYNSSDYKAGFTSIQGKLGFKAPMRYNAWKNVIEFLDTDQVIREVLRRPYITVNIDGEMFEITEFIDEGVEKQGYFNSLNTGKTQLLFMPRKELFIKGRGVTEAYAVYREISSYYIKKEGRPAEKIRLNKKNILNHLEDRAPELTTFISDYGLNLRKEENVVRLLDYYNSLSSLKHGEKEMQS